MSELLNEAHKNIGKMELGEKKLVDWVLPDQILTEPVQNPEIRLLHSIAVIELMSIYMYWDTLSMTQAPNQFYLDMSSIAIEESSHLHIIIERIETLGAKFPCLPVLTHLKELSLKTCDDIKARILLLSLFSEGRALDSKDRIIRKLKAYNNDLVSAKILEKIINDEVSHLQNGMKWFLFFCKENNVEPKDEHDRIAKKINLKYRPPFNKELRDKAGMPSDWYENQP